MIFTLKISRDKYDICNNTDGIMFSYNLGDKISKYSSAFFDNAHGANLTTWAQLKEANTDPLEYYVEELNKKIEQFIADNP